MNVPLSTSVVGLDRTGSSILLGMCKWTTSPVDLDELNLLDWLAPYVDRRAGQRDRYLFSRSGFTDRLAARASTDNRLHLVSPADIYR